MVQIVLTVIGSIGCFISLYYAAKRLANILKSIYAARKAINRIHYYKFVEVSCKWIFQEQEFHGFRTYELVSKIEGHNGF